MIQHTQAIAQSDLSSFVDNLDPKGQRAVCEMRRREAHVASTYYAIQRNDFHASSILSDFAATLVVTGPRDGTALVVGDSGAEKVFSYSRKHMEHRHVIELLRTLDRELTGEAVP